MGVLCGLSLLCFGRLGALALFYYNTIIHYLYLLVNSKYKNNSRLNTIFLFYGFGAVRLCFVGSIRAAATVAACVLPCGGYGRREWAWVGLPTTLENKKGKFAKTY